MDGRERGHAGEMQTGHRHAGHPEEEDVGARRQHRRGIERLVVRRLLRPAEGGERPEGRREPGVEHVRVLGQPVRSRLGRRLLHGPRHEAAAVLRVPGGDLVPPPELARDAPRLDVGEPVLPGLVPALGRQREAAVLIGGQRLRRHLRHVAEPLRRDQRLDRLASPLAVADVVRVLLDLDEPTLVAQPCHHLGAGLEAVEAPRSRGPPRLSCARPARSPRSPAGCGAGPSRSRWDRGTA